MMQENYLLLFLGVDKSKSLSTFVTNYGNKELGLKLSA